MIMRKFLTRIGILNATLPLILVQSSRAEDFSSSNNKFKWPSANRSQPYLNDDRPRFIKDENKIMGPKIFHIYQSLKSSPQQPTPRVELFSLNIDQTTTAKLVPASHSKIRSFKNLSLDELEKSWGNAINTYGPFFTFELRSENDKLVKVLVRTNNKKQLESYFQIKIEDTGDTYGSLF